MAKANDKKATKIAEQSADFATICVVSCADGSAYLIATFIGGKCKTLYSFKSAAEAASVVHAALALIPSGSHKPVIKTA